MKKPEKNKKSRHYPAFKQRLPFLLLLITSVLYLFGVAGPVDYPISAFFVAVFSLLCSIIKT